MIKLLWCIFQQYYGPFTILFVEGSSETGRFRHLSNHVFRVRNFANAKYIWASSFPQKSPSFIPHFKNPEKNREKVFYFWDNCIWIGIIKLSILRTGYLSSAANMITTSPKTWNGNKKDFFQSNCLGSYSNMW